MKIDSNRIIRYTFLIMLSSFLISGCGTTKNNVSFNDVKKGEKLDNIDKISVEQFLQIWINNTYPVKIDINCHELNKDEKYTYFGKISSKLFSSDPDVFKVHNDSLNSKLGIYSKIDGQLIRQEFWERVVSQEDRDIWKTSDCMSGSSRPTYTYELQEHKIKIGLLWQVKCDRKLILDKKYIGYYDLVKREIEK